MNSRGFTAIETIVGVMLLSIAVIIFVNFKNNMLDSELFVNRYITLQSEIDNNLTDIYNLWKTEDYTVDLMDNQLKINIEDLGESEYGTNVLKVNFQMEELTKGYDVDKDYFLERSVYYE